MKKFTKNKFSLVLVLLNLFLTGCSSFAPKKISDIEIISKSLDIRIVRLQENSSAEQQMVSNLVYKNEEFTEEKSGNDFILGIQGYKDDKDYFINKESYGLDSAFAYDFNFFFYTYLEFANEEAAKLAQENYDTSIESGYNKIINRNKLSYIINIVTEESYLDILETIHKENRSKNFLVLNQFLINLKKYNNINFRKDFVMNFQNSNIWADNAMFQEHNLHFVKELSKRNSSRYSFLNQNSVFLNLLENPTDNVLLNKFVKEIFFPWQEELLMKNIEKLILHANKKNRPLIILLKHGTFPSVVKKLTTKYPLLSFQKEFE